MKPKVLAYHLPGFHRIPENDEWHGEGFTEWVTTKKGEVYSKYQYQPKVPLNHNYYDLSKIDDIKWQCEIARKHGVDGFCFYHYWFGGKKIFEKPSELLLNSKDMEIEYCFAWANEEWRNTWTDKLDNPPLLLGQDYSNLNDWKKHFEYLLEFFNDERYIKIDNKPVFLIYHLEQIPNYELRFNEWNEMAIRSGFAGIHLVQMVSGDLTRQIKTDVINAKVDFEPVRSLASKEKYALKPWRIRRTLYDKLVKKNILHEFIFDIVDYSSFWKSILEKKYLKEEDYYYSGFINWDSTPRKGKRAWFMKGATPKLFEYFFGKVYNNTIKEKKPLIFLFAWNEWGEGAYLEPDERFGYGYLEAIRNVIIKENMENNEGVTHD